MGTFLVSIEIGDSAGARWETVEALVDTVASYTSLPASLLRQLGVTPHDRVLFILADARQLQLDVGQTWVRIDGKSVITLVVFGEEGIEPLLGAYTLEGLRLRVDPPNRRLIPIPGLLMVASGMNEPGATSNYTTKHNGLHLRGAEAITI